MISITSEEVQNLGEATMHLDGDALYVLGNSENWGFVWIGAGPYLSSEVLASLHFARESRRGVDWRLLVSSQYDLKVNKFRPPLSHCHVDIVIHSRYSAAEARDYLEDFSELLVQRPIADLTDLHLRGLAKPIYPKARSIVGGSGASSLHYQFENKLYSLPYRIATSLERMGFHLLVPGGQEGIPYTVGHIENAEYPIFCFVTPEKDGGGFLSPDGRPIYTDALAVCWEPEELAFAIFEASDSHDPANLDLYEPFEDILERNSWSTSYSVRPLRTATSILRWQGWTDSEITQLYFEARPIGLQKVINNLQLRVIQRLEELPTLPPNTNGKARKAQIDREVRTICDLFERIMNYTQTQIPLDNLQRLVQEVTQHVE